MSETSAPDPAKKEAEQTGILVWGRIAANVSDGITPLVIVRLLGQADVGAFAALILIYQTLTTMLGAGFPKAVLYFLAGRTAGARRAIMARLGQIMLGLGVITGLLLVVVGRAGPDVLDAVGTWMAETFGVNEDPAGGVGDALKYLPLLGVYAVFDVPTLLLPRMLIAEGRAKASAGVEVFRSVGWLVATLVPAALGYGVGGIAAGIAIFGVFNASLFLAYLRILYRDAPSQRADVPLGELVGYSLPLGITDTIGMLRARLDMWLIVLFFAAERVAEYRMGAWQIPVITTVAFSLGAVQLPRYAQLFKSGNSREAVRVWRQSALKVSLIVVPTAMVFIVAAEEFVSWAFTPEYIRAAGVFRCYCFLVMVRVTDFGSFMMAAGRPGYVLRAAGLTLLASAAISIPLLFTLGFIGPALGAVIAFIPTLYFYCRYIARAAGVRLGETFPLFGYLRVVAAVAVPAGLAIAFKLAFDLHYIAMFWIEALIVLVGWALVGTLLGLIEPADWAFARRWAQLRIFK